MKRIFGISLITLSVSILLLHSFVPHHHSSDKFNLQEILKNEPVKSPIDLLKIGFHINLGLNHLENFQKSSPIITTKDTLKKVSSDYLVISPLTEILEFSLDEINQDFSLLSNKVFKSLFDKSFSYRGPPKNA